MACVSAASIYPGLMTRGMQTGATISNISRRGIRTMMRIVEQGNQRIAILKLIGDPLGEQDANTLREKIYDLRKEEIKHVIFDLSEVHHINSAGLGGLIAAMFTMLKEKGDVRFACVGTNVQRIFKTTHLDEVFNADKTVEEALRSYKHK